MVKYLFLFVAAAACVTGLAGAEEPVVSEAQPVVAEAVAVPLEAVAEPAPSVELLDLRQAQELALRDNTSLQAIEARVGQAQQRVALQNRLALEDVHCRHARAPLHERHGEW